MQGPVCTSQTLYQLGLVPMSLSLVSILVGLAHTPSASTRLAHLEKGRNGQAGPFSALLQRKSENLRNMARGNRKTGSHLFF